MGNDNYHESMEKNRQELSQERMAELTRRARQMPKPKSRGLLLPSLFFIFILIPVTLLIYVAFYYEPDDTLTAKTNENEVSFELNSQPPSDSTVLAAADDQQEDEKEEEKKSAKAKEAEEQKELKEKAREREEKAAAKEKEKEQAAAEQQAEKKAQETALAEQKAREEAEAKAKAEAEAEQRAKAEEKEKEKEQQEEQEETPTAGGKTVTVQSSETLYRIAVNNYGASGAAAAVEKIKQANGLASNDISPGQTLILP
ncbi:MULTISPECIES: LysM peptidoglycan-binding domain-containing protein [unclassified Planococcus (in: firmicutes)]|uniref:LysM peptidoglycan-binding domain-containing protein n=1 Tax=unclassified Planococcus (in: firmicutes) TaxID=2662419 RepID=UPI000C3468B7|nr:MULTISPECIES: LysM peptidoglycan-binding domain-containing protein [unclassified Planococcus (in: firmicutes)]AUD14027.1 elastin-binding protein EbpS [Planococcus sp. MB-3u-03]PKG48025.1 elastin-binding protein EbpS [Planococcus sp. Urea-trap-24]PKG91873.1 elastin-binding protein EbpS [Planococcus sp. Urea-3u-39]PKH43223.1 elastin-binding protein EbpS [Planococcus sp. MB-3u-09]